MLKVYLLILKNRYRIFNNTHDDSAALISIFKCCRKTPHRRQMCTHLFEWEKKPNCLFSPLPFFPPKKHVAAFQQQFHWFSPPALPYLPLISLAVLHELWGVWSHKNNIFENCSAKTFWRKSIFTPLPHVKLKRANPELLPCSAVLPPYEWKICPPHSKGAGVFHTHIYMTQFHCSW